MSHAGQSWFVQWAPQRWGKGQWLLGLCAGLASCLRGMHADSQIVLVLKIFHKTSALMLKLGSVSNLSIHMATYFSSHFFPASQSSRNFLF